MNSDKRTDLIILSAAAVLAAAAIAAPVLGAGQPVALLAVLGGILLGPGSLGYRLATGSKWAECLTIGVALNVAAVMLLALVAVAVHFWHPKVELVIPLATCVLAAVLYRRGARGGEGR